MGHTKILSESQEVLEDCFLHLDEKNLVTDNTAKPLAEGMKEENYKEINKYALGADFFKPCATNL